MNNEYKAKYENILAKNKEFVFWCFDIIGEDPMELPDLYSNGEGYPAVDHPQIFQTKYGQRVVVFHGYCDREKVMGVCLELGIKNPFFCPPFYNDGATSWGFRYEENRHLWS